jgi:signal transduction histidine kinase
VLPTEHFRHLGGGRRGVFLILRYVFIISASYLLLFAGSNQSEPVQPAQALMIAAALASNVVLSFVSSELLFAWYVEAPVLIGDTLWVSWALQSTGAIGGEFFLLYFFVLMLAAMGESPFMVVLGSTAVSMANVYSIHEMGPWTPALLLRIVFFFAVALFYGHVLGEIKKERRRADRGLAWAKDLESRVAERTVELRRLYDEAQAASRAKSEFVASMSHELRTPLHIIIGYTDMLRDCVGVPEAVESAAMLDRIRETAASLIALVDNILQLGKLDAGRVPVAVEPVPLDRFAAELQHSERIPLAPRVVLQWRLPSALPVVHTDAAKLGIVLNNLINNAIKFTSEGAITVSVRDLPEEELVEFRVDDSGRGIDEQHLQTIFEPFQQVDGADDTNPHGGVGLGLAIVRRHIALLGAQIAVRSMLHRGSSFVVSLPYSPPLGVRSDNGAGKAEPRAPRTAAITA